MNSNQIKEIQYLRGFAIIAVIIIHTSDYASNLNLSVLSIANLFLNYISRFAVPLFVLLSGIVLSLKYNTSMSIKPFYIKRMKSILPQYLFFSLFYLIVPLSLHMGSLTIPPISKIFSSILLANSSGHLWFIPMIIQFYLLYPYLISMYEKTNNVKVFILISAIIQNIWLIINKGLFSSCLNDNILNITQFIFLSHLFYFILGIYVGRNYIEIKSFVVSLKWTLSHLFILSTIIIYGFIIKCFINVGTISKIPSYCFGIVYMLHPIYFPVIFSILLIISIKLKDVNKVYSSVIFNLGNYSFGIYLIHALFLRELPFIMNTKMNINYTQWEFYPLLFILTLGLSYLSVYFISYLPCSEAIIGIKNR